MSVGSVGFYPPDQIEINQPLGVAASGARTV
jgi:hypothetical protein